MKARSWDNSMPFPQEKQYATNNLPELILKEPKSSIVYERSLSRPVAVPGACCRVSCPGLPEEVLTNCWWVFSILVSCPIPRPHLPTLELPSPPSLWQPVLSLSQGLWQKQTRKALGKASFLPKGRVRQDAEEESRPGSPEIRPSPASAGLPMVSV